MGWLLFCFCQHPNCPSMTRYPAVLNRVIVMLLEMHTSVEIVFGRHLHTFTKEEKSTDIHQSKPKFFFFYNFFLVSLHHQLYCIELTSLLESIYFHCCSIFLPSLIEKWSPLPFQLQPHLSTFSSLALFANVFGNQGAREHLSRMAWRQGLTTNSIGLDAKWLFGPAKSGQDRREIKIFKTSMENFRFGFCPIWSFSLKTSPS